MAHAAKLGALTDDLINAIAASTPRVRCLVLSMIRNILTRYRKMLVNSDIPRILPSELSNHNSTFVLINSRLTPVLKACSKSSMFSTMSHWPTL